MSFTTSRQIVLASRPTGRPQLNDFRLEEVPIPATPAGGLLLRVHYLSLDPYMRGRMSAAKSYAASVEIGSVMVGESVSEVVRSDSAHFRVGEFVLAHTGWRDYAMSDGKGLRKLDPSRAPLTTGLGVLGMPGFTAWSGLHLIGKPKAGETVAVAAASGPVGSLVGQLAQLVGARAVGIAGGAQKCDYVKNVLRFDAVVDHRSANFAEALAQACPDGIDVYFENVGGAVWDAVLPLLNPFARIPVCGLIAQYNDTGNAHATRDRLPGTMRQVLSKSLSIRGFINNEFAQEYPVFLDTVSAGVADGRIQYLEDITDGLENAPAAFIGMLDGSNFGKAIVRVAV